MPVDEFDEFYAFMTSGPWPKTTWGEMFLKSLGDQLPNTLLTDRGPADIAKYFAGDHFKAYWRKDLAKMAQDFIGIQKRAKEFLARKKKMKWKRKHGRWILKRDEVRVIRILPPRAEK